MVRKLGNINQKLVNRSTCRKLPAKSAGIYPGYVIPGSASRSNGGSDNERLQSIWMEMSYHRNNIVAANNDNMNHGIQQLTVK